MPESSVEVEERAEYVEMTVLEVVKWVRSIEGKDFDCYLIDRVSGNSDLDYTSFGYISRITAL